MKKIIQFSALCLILSLILMASTSYALVFKEIKIGRYWDRVNDACHQAQREGRFGQYIHNSHGVLARGYMFNNTSTHIGCKDWTDPATGTVYEYWIGGAGHVAPNESNNFMPIVEEDGLTIHKYWRFEPPLVVVDGFRSSDPMRDGDEVDPGYIPGTADVMVESSVNTMLGITIHQRVYAWSQQNHDDYHIYDWTLTNTGNLDLDDEIETTQTIKDFYIAREGHYSNTWNSWHWWPSRVGEFPGDTLRASFIYPARSHTHAQDLLGDVRTSGNEIGYMRQAWAGGDATLFCSSAPNMLNIADDDPSQPRITATNDQDLTWDKPDAIYINAEDRQTCYNAMSQGTAAFTQFVQPDYPDALLAYPGSHHGITIDDMCLYGYDVRYPKDANLTTARHVSWQSYGPFTLEHGQSIRLVWARGAGSMTPEKIYEVGQAWRAGTAADLWEGDWHLPPPMEVYPELSPTDNDKAKDSWVTTSVDSFFRNVYNAQWNFRQGYQIPTAPPPPSLEVTSLPDGIRVTWGVESDAAPDLAGFRIYRAKGNYTPKISSGQMIGTWELITSVDKGTHTYTDETAERGQAYYYAVTAYDNGTNIPDVSAEDGHLIYPANQVLESSIYLNRTVVAAQLTRPAGNSLDEIRIVPNPFNINAVNLQYTGTNENMINFLDLPPVCTIRIFTESGDLIQTIEHTSESGDESWGGKLPQRHSATESGQRIVSGIYIAHFETPDGQSIIRKFVVVR
ncbi:hypothetical protein JW824_05250 [bacterium]|nr:hypothetical protein [bacterium]RQV96513.1 MAG: hypothetical protein EH221_04780 [bacterium]